MNSKAHNLCGLGLSQQQFEVKSRPLLLRPGLDSARLSDLDNDLEVEEFLSKNTADTGFSRFQGVPCKNPLL